jgi:hypothetical protein
MISTIWKFRVWGQYLRPFALLYKMYLQYEAAKPKKSGILLGED